MGETKTIRRFTCPKCGGMLIRPQPKGQGDVVVICYDDNSPTCNTCKSEYTIVIKNDYSYEIKENKK